MGGSRAGKWIQLSVGGIVLVAVALVMWGFDGERDSAAPDGKASDGSPAARSRPTGSNAQSVLPEKIGEMRLVTVQQGQEAIQQINGMHGHNIGLRAGYIAGFAGGGNDASIWIARMASSAEARSLIDQMTDMIRPNKSYFTDLQQMQKYGRTIFGVNSGGQRHFYYQAADKVIWLSVGGPDPDGVLHSALAVLN